MESTTYLLIDEAGQEHAIFTGDTLFIGDVGRPDLAVKSDLTQEDLAKNLFHSLRNKIMTLPDDVIVYPAHGAGSACGKNMSKETYDTLGNQKQKNYALRSDMTIEEFVTEVTTGLSAPPKYFPQNVMMNKMGYESIDNVMKTGLQALDPDQFEDVANAYGAVVIDTRKAEHFAAGFIPNSINIGIDGQFAPWVGALLPDVKQHILIIADDGREEEVVLRLARVGYDFCLGYLKGGFTSWKNSRKDFDTITSISANELEKRYNKGEELAILDVRRPSEFAAEHLENANNIPLDFINDYMAEINPNQHYYIHCAGGYRSMIFASILKARGFDNITDVAGGFKAIAENTQMKRTDYVCPSTLKKS
jgi:rhodanese-related sulfurtransferase